MVSGEFNSQVLQEAEQEGYLVLRKPLEPAKLHALLTQWGGKLTTQMAQVIRQQ